MRNAGLARLHVAFVAGSLAVTQEVLAINSAQAVDALAASSNVQVVVGSGGDLTVNSAVDLDSGGQVSVTGGGRMTAPGIDSQPAATGIDLDGGALRGTPTSPQP